MADPYNHIATTIAAFILVPGLAVDHWPNPALKEEMKKFISFFIFLYSLFNLSLTHLTDAVFIWD